MQDVVAIMVALTTCLKNLFILKLVSYRTVATLTSLIRTATVSITIASSWESSSLQSICTVYTHYLSFSLYLSHLIKICMYVLANYFLVKFNYGISATGFYYLETNAERPYARG